MGLFSPSKLPRTESEDEWCTAGAQSKHTRMWTWKRRAARWLSERRWRWGSAVKVLRYPPLSGVSHKYTSVLAKQAARVASCVCVSQILLMSGLNQPGPTPPPTNLHPHPRKSRKHPHTYSHLRPPRLSTAPTLFLPSLIFFPSVPPSFFPPPSSLSRAEEEQGEELAWVGGSGKCVWVC